MTLSTAPLSSPPWQHANAYVAILLSALVPGIGQIYAGRRRRGILLLVITGLVIFVLAMTLQDKTTWLVWSVQPTSLRWILAGNGFALAFRVFAAADALFSPSLRQSIMPGGRMAAALLISGSFLVLTLPHAYAGYLDVVQYDLITTVFAPTSTLPPAPPSQSTSTTTTPDQPANHDPGGAPASPPTSTSITTTTTTVPVRLWDGTERLNVLLLGGDGGKGRTSIRTDTIILVSIDPESGATAMFSVPRNMAQVPLPAQIDIWDCDCFPGIINALWRWADDRPGRFEDLTDPGADVLKLAIGTLVDLDIHYYALINLEGFIELVDAIGGIDITVPTRVRDRYSGPDGVSQLIDLAPGEYHFDGYDTLGYVRVSKASSDYSRMGRERCVLRAMAKQADPLTVIRAFPAIASVLKNNLFTDIPLGSLPDFIELLPLIKADEIVLVRFIPDRFTGPRTPDFYPTPDLSEIRTVVQDVLSATNLDVVEDLELEDLGEACG